MRLQFLHFRPFRGDDRSRNPVFTQSFECFTQRSLRLDVPSQSDLPVETNIEPENPSLSGRQESEGIADQQADRSRQEEIGAGELCAWTAPSSL